MVSVVQLSWTWSHWYLAQRAENHRKWQQTKGKIAPACVLWGVGGFFGGQSTDPPKKSVATGQFLSSLRASQISLDVWHIWCNLIVFIVYIQATKSLKCAAVAQWRSAGTYYDLYCYSEYYRPPPPPGHQTGRRTRRWLASLGAVFGLDGLEWCSPLEFRDDGGNS